MKKHNDFLGFLFSINFFPDSVKLSTELDGKMKVANGGKCRRLFL